MFDRFLKRPLHAEHFYNCFYEYNVFRNMFRTQLNIYDGTFLQKLSAAKNR